MRLKELRSERGLSQKELADVLDCSVTVYSRYETGAREPSLDTLIRLADFYGVTLDELVGRAPMDVVVLKENAPPPSEDEYEIVIEPGEHVPSSDDLERRITEIVQRELQKKGL